MTRTLLRVLVLVTAIYLIGLICAQRISLTWSPIAAVFLALYELAAEEARRGQ